jgi:hypothetical protein
LIQDEGAGAVIHSGDFDYQDNPAAWDGQINAILGDDFPYFASVGNHDVLAFDGSGGYQDLLEARMTRLGIPWQGDLGVQSSFYYQGIFIVLTAPGVFSGPLPHDEYIRDELAGDDSIWRISSWHKNMTAMQLGGKSNDTGWGVYEESRAGGSIIATGHEHSYSRTHLLSSCRNQTVASMDNTLVLSQDDPNTPADEGRSFVFVSGIAGKSIRNQDRCLPKTFTYGCNGEWASIYTLDQGANYGALFGVFNYQGDPRRAHFYFKDIDGDMPDEFFVESTLGLQPPDESQQACITALNQALARVTKVQSRDIYTCIKDGAKGKLGGTIEACLTSDLKGRLARAMAKTESEESNQCNIPPPDFGATDAATVNAAATDHALDLIHDVFGTDLDVVIFDETGDQRSAARCQQGVVKAVRKCHDTKLAEFNRCKKAGLGNGDVQSAEDLAGCVFQPSSQRGGKACAERITRTIEKKCVASVADLPNAFPGCSADDADALAACPLV